MIKHKNNLQIRLIYKSWDLDVYGYVLPITEMIEVQSFIIYRRTLNVGNGDGVSIRSLLAGGWSFMFPFDPQTSSLFIYQIHQHIRFDL